MFLTLIEFEEKTGKVLDQKEFDMLLTEAETEIENYSFGRVGRRWDLMPALVKEKVKNAAVDLILEELKSREEELGRVVESESVGPHTVKYKYYGHAAEKPENIIKKHLMSTGLLYRGLLYGD